MHNASFISATPDAEESIVYCARVSNPKNQGSGSSPARLIRYLIEHRHWSPFEMAHLVVEVNTTRAIAAQVIRHRSFSFQEFSQRYSAVGELAEPQIPDIRLQHKTQKQISHGHLDPALTEEMETRIQGCFNVAREVYTDLLEVGAARENARDVLPLATPTRLYMAGTIRSFIHYLETRTHRDTQKEHRQVAESIWSIFKDKFPIIASAISVYRQEEAEKHELWHLYNNGELSYGSRAWGTVTHTPLAHNYQDDYGVNRVLSFSPSLRFEAGKGPVTEVPHFMGGVVASPWSEDTISFGDQDVMTLGGEDHFSWENTAPSEFEP